MKLSDEDYDEINEMELVEYNYAKVFNCTPHSVVIRYRPHKRQITLTKGYGYSSSKMETLASTMVGKIVIVS